MTLAEAEHPIAQTLTIINDTINVLGNNTDTLDRFLPDDLVILCEAPGDTNDFITRIKVLNLSKVVLSASEMILPNRSEPIGTATTDSGSGVRVLAKITTKSMLGSHFPVFIGPNMINTPKVDFLIFASGVGMAAVDEHDNSRDSFASTNSNEYEQVYVQMRRLAAIEQLKDTSLKLGAIELVFEDFDFDN